jgi:hypothetical protein
MSIHASDQTGAVISKSKRKLPPPSPSSTSTTPAPDLEAFKLRWKALKKERGGMTVKEMKGGLALMG